VIIKLIYHGIRPLRDCLWCCDLYLYKICNLEKHSRSTRSLHWIMCSAILTYTRVWRTDRQTDR